MVEHSLRMRGARGSIPLISIQFFSRKSSQRKEKESVIREKRRRGKGYEAFVPEWSKGADLSSAIVRCVGSNPTGCIFGRKKSGKKKQEKRKEGREVSVSAKGILRSIRARVV